MTRCWAGLAKLTALANSPCGAAGSATLGSVDVQGTPAPVSSEDAGEVAVALVGVETSDFRGARGPVGSWVAVQPASRVTAVAKTSPECSRRYLHGRGPVGLAMSRS